MTMLLAAFTGLWAAVVALGLRVYLGWVPGSFISEIGACLLTAILTGLIGPAVFRVCRFIDRQFRLVSHLSVPSGPGGVAGGF